jgi:hypothetical protein
VLARDGLSLNSSPLGFLHALLPERAHFPMLIWFFIVPIAAKADRVIKRLRS